MVSKKREVKTPQATPAQAELNTTQAQQASLLSQIEVLEKEKATLSKQLTALDKDKTKIGKQVTTLEKDKVKLSQQVETSQAQIAQLITEKEELAQRIEELQKGKAEVKVEDMAGVLKSALQSLQREVKGTEAKGEAGYIVDKFEVEMKSGLDLSEGLKLVQPTATELKPESLSTVKISFKARPPLKIAEE